VGDQISSARGLLPHEAYSAVFNSTQSGAIVISPYLFFWQASQEPEEERAKKRTLAQRRGATNEEPRRLKVDVVTGMFASNFIMYFMILTTAATLNKCARDSENRDGETSRGSAAPVSRKRGLPLVSPWA
jgi:Mn2+/Fe2+ NRAMP family transporter